MKRGDKITIYQDPITEQDFEGIAFLITPLSFNEGCFDGRKLERWLVKFASDLYVCERTILNRR